MKHSNIFWGTLLVGVGMLLLMDRLEVLHFDWWAFGKLWPFLIILWGVSILPIKGGIKIPLALVVVVGSIFMYSNYAERADHRKSFSYHFDDNDADEADDSEQEKPTDLSFSEAYSPEIKRAILEMDAGAGTFVLQGSTSELIYCSNKGFGNQFDYRAETMDSTATIQVKQQSKVKMHNSSGNKFNLMLNTNPLWDFDIDVGAAELDLDLSNHKVNKIDINGGAASIDVRIGTLQTETDIEINAGASSIEIRIPAGAGCRITGSTVLSSRNFDGFEKLDKGHYETSNFNSAAQKINISVEAAVSSFSVIRE